MKALALRSIARRWTLARPAGLYQAALGSCVTAVTAAPVIAASLPRKKESWLLAVAGAAARREHSPSPASTARRIGPSIAQEGTGVYCTRLRTHDVEKYGVPRRRSKGHSQPPVSEPNAVLDPDDPRLRPPSKSSRKRAAHAVE